MKTKAFILLGFLLAVLALALPSGALAGTERATTADPVFADGGNKTRPIGIAESTTTAVLISSASTATDACKGSTVGSWRGRLIINSSDGMLQLLPSSAYTVFSDTFGVVLGSDTANGKLGDAYPTDEQGAIWGIWSSSTTKGGAAGEEQFWCQ